MKVTRLNRTEFELKMRDESIVVAPKNPDDVFTAEQVAAIVSAFRTAMAHRAVPLPLPGKPMLTNLRTGEVFVLDEATL